MLGKTLLIVDISGYKYTTWPTSKRPKGLRLIPIKFAFYGFERQKCVPNFFDARTIFDDN